MSVQNEVTMEESMQLTHDLSALCAATEVGLPTLVETERRLRARVHRRSETVRRLVLAGGVVAACGTALGAPRFFEREAPTAAPAKHTVATPEARHAVDPPSAPASKAEARVQRDALRTAIVRHAASTEALPTPASETGLKNKLGPGREALVKFLNAEFTPLVDECYEQAIARSPELKGMYRLSLGTLADEQLGAVVDVAEPGAGSEVTDPEFFECLRESAFTLVIPAPLTTGQEQFEMSGYFGEPPDEE